VREVIGRRSAPTTRALQCGAGSVLLAPAAVLSSCEQQQPDRRSDARQLTSQIQHMPGVRSATSDVADNIAEGRVHVWITVHVADDITADQLAAVTTRYTDGLHSADYTGYDTELVVHQGDNRFVIGTGRQSIANADRLVARARDWVGLRHEFPSAAPRIPQCRSQFAHHRCRPVRYRRDRAARPRDYTAVTAAVTTLGARFPQLAGGNWTITPPRHTQLPSSPPGACPQPPNSPCGPR
jgi:hypothetical protein